MAFDDFKVVHDEPMAVGECPLWHHGEGALYWVDIDGFTVHRLHPDSGGHASWRMESEPAALAIHAGGGLVVARRDGFVHLDTVDGTVTPIAVAPYDTATARFNDGRVDPAGRFWVGTRYERPDQQGAAMYCLDHGQVRTQWSGGMTNSNGLGFTPDGRHMYHADTTAHRIDRYDFDAAAGIASNPRPFQQFANNKAEAGYGGRPDGAAVDSEGNYWCAMFEGGRLLCFAPDGKLLREVKLPLRCPTMIAFGGRDLKTLYITSASHKRPAEELAEYPLSGHVLSLQVEVPGQPEPAYRP
jgi:sugar lactone lactonase YvrE